jgi:hypothetical protein
MKLKSSVRGGTNPDRKARWNEILSVASVQSYWLRSTSKATMNRLKGLTMAIATLCIINAGDAVAGERPITDFLKTQGTFIPGIYVPWIDPTSGTILYMDYAGVDNNLWSLNLATSYSGSVNENLLADGRAEVSVMLHTQNAITYTGPFPPPTSPCGCSLIGNAPVDVLNGAPLALGDCTLQLRFINPGGLGADLPDFFQLVVAPLPGQTQLFIGFVGQATGPLPDGTAGLVQTRQTGLVSTSQIANPNSRVALDGFPVEHVIIRPVGK